MFHDWFERQLRFYNRYRDTKQEGTTLYALGLGGLEIALIVAAVILIFGVGKLGNVGGALGKSIREFRKEKDKVDDDSQLNSKKDESKQLDKSSQDENKN